MKPTDFAKYITDFMTTYLTEQRGCSVNTVIAYRDAIVLMLTFYKEQIRIPAEKITLKDITMERILSYLEWLEKQSCTIFGAVLDSMLKTVEIVEASGPDVIDINFGCPVKKVVSKGAGAGILKDIDLMVSLTEAMVKHTTLPVTVKTRLGWDHDSIKILEVAERLQDVGCQALSIHGRTRAQMYKGEADWKPIAEVKNNPRMHIPIFGNGDVDTPEKAMEMRDKYGLDGAMIGRASIGYPWFFREVKHYFETGEYLAAPNMVERVDAARRHLQMAIDWKGEKLGVFETRRHYTNYFKGIPNFKEYRMKMVTSDDSASVFEAFDEVLQVFWDYEFV